MKKPDQRRFGRGYGFGAAEAHLDDACRALDRVTGMLWGRDLDEFHAEAKELRDRTVAIASRLSVRMLQEHRFGEDEPRSQKPHTSKRKR